MWKISKKWLEEQGLVDFIKKDIRKRQLCRLSSFSSGEDLFQHVAKVNGYGSLVHLGLVHYLSILHKEEIKPPKKRKKASVIVFDITSCYTFCIKR